MKSSPCDHPEFELALCEGDLLKVYGREMEDGFVVGEVSRRGGVNLIVSLSFHGVGLPTGSLILTHYVVTLFLVVLTNRHTPSS